jgi:MSHA biogenesis protein MshO
MVELIVTIVVLSVMGVTVGVFLKPAIDAYFAGQQRSDLAEQSDLSVRRMLADVRRAVPHSMRLFTSKCFEVVPTAGGGRYRMAAGSDVMTNTPAGCSAGPSATCSAWVDNTGETSRFDALNITGSAPAANDWVVIDNQNGGEVYDGSNRALVSSVGASPNSQGVLRINIATTQFHQGYVGGRFQTVSANEPRVAYVCTASGIGTDSEGTGTGTLYRVVRDFSDPASCPDPTGAPVVVRNVKACTIVYDANQGATQQNGFVWINLQVARKGETAGLAVGAHVMNAP